MMLRRLHVDAVTADAATVAGIYLPYKINEVDQCVASPKYVWTPCGRGRDFGGPAANSIIVQLYMLTVEST